MTNGGEKGVAEKNALGCFIYKHMFESLTLYDDVVASAWTAWTAWSSTCHMLDGRNGRMQASLKSKLGALWHPWHRGKASVLEATTAVSLTRRRWKIRKWTWWLLELPFLEKTSFNGRLILREYCLNINGLFMWFEASSIFFVSFPYQ